MPRSRWSVLILIVLAGCVELFARGTAPTSRGVIRVDGQGGRGGTSTSAAGPTTSGSTSADAGASTASTRASDAGTPLPEGAIVDLALGENHTCALEGSGRVRCWGYNVNGQLGIGSMQHPGDGVVSGIGDASDGAVRAIAAGGYQTCALTAAGRVWCWGSNHDGQVGTGEATESAVRTPTLVRGVDDVVELALGDSISCAITRARALYCWGNNSQHEIDDSVQRNRPSATRVAGVEPVDLVAVGNYHLCVVRSGRVTCRGQLAQVRDVARLERVTSISAGWGHTCAISDGVPYCWGRSYLGVLGRGDPCPGRQSTCDADVYYPPAAVPGVTGAVQVDGHDYHSCVRLESGSVTCWGNNQGHAFADDLPAEPSQTAHPIRGFDRADALIVGGTHLCILRNATPTCTGNPQSGAVRWPR